MQDPNIKKFLSKSKTVVEKYKGQCPYCGNLLHFCEASYFCIYCGFSEYDFNLERGNPPTSPGDFTYVINSY
jgi:hypothetical protein